VPSTNCTDWLTENRCMLPPSGAAVGSRHTVKADIESGLHVGSSRHFAVSRAGCPIWLLIHPS
jgi:hypothetical protein